VGAWTVVRRPQFTAKLQDNQKALNLKLDELKAKHWPSGATDEFLPLAEEFDKFSDEVDEIVSSPDPLSKLKFFSKDSNGAVYYVLRSGNWRAYYAVDEKAKSAVALLALHKAKGSAKQILAELESALTQYRKEKG